MRNARHLLAILFVLAVAACTPAGNSPNEALETGIPPTAQLRVGNWSGPTPTSIPGARRVTTSEVADAMRLNPAPVILDVAGGNGHATLPGAIWLPGAGAGTSFDDDVQRQLVAAAERLAGGDKSRTIITLCPNQACWLSYNAALRLTRAGFQDVRWYRGGYMAWAEAGRPTVAATRTSW